tara:strand:+ start:15293 stop:17107 length:1815 start_codon:yes stop_codon:yes gene_type:complete
MKNIRILNFLAILSLVIIGCNPLKKMIELSKEQQINVNPNPMIMKGSNVTFDVESTLPKRMLPKGTSYTLNFAYDGNDAGSIEFKASDYPNSVSSVSKSSKTLSIPYNKSMIDNPSKLTVVGNAKIIVSGKNLNTESSDVADGVNTTQRWNQAWRIAHPKTTPGYTDAEETEATNVSFYFNQGSSYLKGSEKKSDRGEKFSAFLAEKNVTKSIDIIGAHSPEGSTKINEALAGKRGGTIEKYYREQMDKYDYKDEADEISFDLVPVVENWDALRRTLRASNSLSRDEKSQVSSIINGGGSFVDKEKALSKLSSYKTLMKDVYPDLRTAKTEVITVINKKPNNEILAIAQNIVNGSASGDALTHGELLFAAGLTPDLKEKAAIYQAAVKWGGSWKAHSDFGSVHVQLAKQEESGTEAQLKLLEAAETQLNISINKEESAEAYLNLAAACAVKYEWEAANEYLTKAANLNDERTKNALYASQGTIAITGGNYEKAIVAFDKVGGTGGYKAWSLWRKSIANLVLGNVSDAKSSMDSFGKLVENNEWDLPANYYYVLAICAARDGNSSAITKNLTTAFSMDYRIDLKNKAVNDLEFKDYASAIQAALK